MQTKLSFFSVAITLLLINTEIMAKDTTCMMSDAWWNRINLTLMSCDVHEAFKESEEIRIVKLKSAQEPHKHWNLSSIRAITFQKNTPVLPINLGHEFPNVVALGAFGKQLIKIQQKTFAGMNRLELLYLHDNEISLIEPGSFDHLRSLKTLKLRNNKLTKIDRFAFGNLTALEVLDLGQNNIISVDFDVITTNLNLKILFLNGKTFFETFNLKSLLSILNHNTNSSALSDSRQSDRKSFIWVIGILAYLTIDLLFALLVCIKIMIDK